MNWKVLSLGLLLAGCSGRPAPLPVVPATPASALWKWQSPPPLAPEGELALALSIRRVTLDNGLSLTVITRPHTQVTALELWVPSAGDRSEGIVSVMADALRAGTRVDGKTVLVNPKLAYEPIVILTNPKGTSFSWQALTRATEPAIGLLGHFVFHPVFEAEETRDRLQASLTSIQGYAGGPRHLANIARDVLPGVDLPTPEQDARGLFRLSPELLASVHRCVMSPRGAELAVVGPLSFEQVEPWARAAFGSIAVPPHDPSCDVYAIAPLNPENMRLSQVELGIIYGGAFDPVVMMSMPGPPSSSPDYVPFALLPEILEVRDAGSAQELRHMGATYGIHFGLNDSFPGLTLLEVQGQVEPDNAQQALRQVIEDIRGVSETLTAEQLEEVKRRWRNQYVNALSSNRAIADAALWQIQRGRSPAEMLEWPKELMQISVEQCRAVARHWLSEARPSVAVAGLPVKLVRGLNLSVHVREMYWTDKLQEQKKSL
jgi:predicted Zn-dependent peptidase